VDEVAEGHIPLSGLRTVHRALSTVNAAVGLGATLRAIADSVIACTPFTLAVVNVANADGDLTCAVTAGSAEMEAALLGEELPRRDVEDILKRGECWGSLCFVRGLGANPPENIRVYVPEVPRRPETGEYWQPDYDLLAPMYDAESRLVGLLSFAEPSDGLMPAPWVIEVIEMFAEQAAIAIGNAARHDEAMQRMQSLETESRALREDIAQRVEAEAHLRHQARHDALTGLANPVELAERLTALLADQIPLAVVFCDLDRFKEVNDTKGHGFGDQVLKVAAARLRELVRGEDVVARPGGDEFVVVAAGIGPDEALALLDRIDQAFSHPMRINGDKLLVRASLGLAYEQARPENSVDPEVRAMELLGNADREMYAHKRSRAAFTQLSARAWAHRAPVAGSPGR
jgi:diguanylate cyclase (GGDEF)-like protein